MTLTTVYPNFPIEVLIPLVLVILILAFAVCPFFFAKCFLIKKVQRVEPENANELVSNTKSLSAIEVKDNVLVLTRAEGVSTATIEVSADVKGILKANRKFVIDFKNEDKVEISFKKNIKAIYVSEPNKESGVKSIFLGDFYSCLIIAGAQFLAVAFMTLFTVYAYAGFNVMYSRLWIRDYNYAYLCGLLAPVVAGISFFLNYRSMKKPTTSLKGGK